ncbi:uncharacterized protein LOC113511946 [Galleria mellonella]|uniref:Uncharacterized protein LOC113511946 n=1 Tax=Galleria mellonella TaxID=7137 RepID=A0A6J1WDT9_GALME|nr:uncharacterized protein LOC113511946 [Galleria mellonella]XP_031765181.2 uncharacterized protein LOC113511946 [Galleria mellonella]XP_052759424.1 uncharacterized protein LOC113511946 [Galleria mellonella]
METEELTKLVDGIYKNILDKFNPGARQMITAGKAYLKALHGAAAASRLYVDAVGKLGRQAQQGTWGGCADIGTALMKVVEVYREIQDQQMNILKAFYVDLLVPLETNLEKDTKVVQSEQKRFLQQHKLRSESYSKAAATIKKQRKKKTNVTKVGSAMDKEMKNMQILEEEKTKLDAFCEQSLKNAMTQERRRYGFVLERQCSLAKHWLAYHAAGAASYNAGLDEWLEVSRTREYLPPNVEAMFVSRMRQVSFWADEEVYASPRTGDDDDRASVGSALRKTRSVDASCLDIRSIGDLGSPTQGLSRAKSDFNLQASSHNADQETDSRTAIRPSSLAPPTCTSRDPPLARALYAYAAAGDNQLGFQQGDLLALLGERTKGWQYGENLRTHQAGWFPLAYTEPIANDEPTGSSPARWGCAQTPNEAPPPAPVAHAQTTPSTPSVHGHPPARMFGDTVTAHHVNKGRLGNSSPGLPPTLPAPSPSALSSSASATFHASTPASAPSAIKNSTSSASFTTHAVIETRSFGPQTLPMRSQVTQNKAGPAKTVVSAVGAVGNVSLHSSNDSGFSNEPPPQPDIDYSDEEAQRLRVPISKPAQSANDHKAYLLKTQSLRRGPKPPNANGYLTDDQQLMLRNMLDMDKDSQRVKRTKSFWKFGRTTSEEIMEGMSLWQHRDIVDTVPEFKKRLYDKMKKELRPAPDIPDIRKQASPEKTSVSENAHQRPKETIDRKEIKVATNGIRQAKSLGSIQTEEHIEKAKKGSENFQQNQTMSKKSTSEKAIAEEKHEDFIPRIESRHSDLTNTSTIKTNFENSFYNDENGEGFVMKTVKRREILQRYDNDSSSEVNSVVSSTDPYDCIIVDDHMTSRKQQELDRRRQAQLMEEEVKKRKENAYMPEFEEIEITPIKPHIRATMPEKVKKHSHERTPPKTMEFKTFKDNSKEIKTFSASSETLKYKDNEQHTDRYGIPTERNNNDIRNDEHYNGHDEGTLKYKKRSSKEEKSRQQNIFENGKNHKKEYPQAEVRTQKKDAKPYDNREPRIDYSLDRRHLRNDFPNSKNRGDPRSRSRVSRSYDDSSLPYNGRRDERFYESNISYFSDQERHVSRYDYETDSKKAEKSKIRQEEARLEARRFVDRRSEGPYSESDDQKFNEALKQQRPQLLPRTKLLKRTAEGNELPEEGHTFGPWYDLWGRETAVYK